MIQNKRAVLQVLGGIIKNPELMLNSEYRISEMDFQESIHKVICLAVSDLIKQDVLSMDAITIDSYLSAYPAQYKLFQDNRGIELVRRLVEVHQEDSFDYWYQMLKKFTLLRELNGSGIDITEIFDPNETNVDKIEAMNLKLSEMTVQDIVDYFSQKFLDVKEKWSSSAEDYHHFRAGDNAKSLKERLKQTPSMGHSFVNPYLTTALRGMRRKKLILVSGASGSGKSRTQIANAVHVAIPWLYDLEKKRWVKRDEESKPVLYISTELQEDEILTVMMAYLSGVDEGVILDGSYQGDEEARVDKACELLEQYPIECVHISDFDIKDIETLIEKMIIKHKIEYVFYDYLHSTPKILQYYNKVTGSHLAEHQILYLFGNALKNLVNKYDIFMYTSTQLNRNYKDEQNLDASAIRGAMSLADKLDAGLISLPPSEKDIEKLATHIEQAFGEEPNMCHTIYKNRGNRYKSVRIWTRLDLGSVREKFLFATDDRYRKIPLEATFVNTLDEQIA